MRKIKIGWLTQWPVHYHLPIYKGLSLNPDIDLTVIFCDDITLKGYFEKDMNTVRTWDDLDMLEGYQSKFLKNYTTHNNDRELLTVINPGIILEVFRGNYDVMVIGGYMGVTYWLAVLACKLTKTRTIFKGESTLNNINRGKLTERIKKYALKIFFRLIDTEFFSCTGNKEFLDFYSVGNNQISLPCAVDNAYYQSKYFENLSARELLRHELGIADNEVVITTVGKLVERKNPLGIIRSVAECQIKNPVILYVGDGPLKAAIQREADANEVKVIFTGYKITSDVAKYYSISDIYFQISRYDPSPKSLNEAMNFYLPIIVTNVIGTAIDLVSHDQNGFIVDQSDQSQLTNALNSLNTREVRETMGRKSAEIIRGHSIELSVEQAIITFKALTFQKGIK